MCFGDWSHEDLVSNAELIEFLKAKGKGKATEDAEHGDNVVFVDDDLFLL